MKSIFTFAAVLLSIASFGQSKTETEIINLSKKRIQYLLESKADSLAAIYDDNSVTVHSNGMIATKDEQINGIKRGFPTYRSIEVKNPTVRDFGSTAVLVGQGNFKITMNGQNMDYNMVYTEVYQKTNNTWKLIARHASALN